METKGFSITVVTDDGEEAHEFTDKRMLDKLLHDQDERISKIETIYNYEIRDITSVTDENDKQIFHETNPKNKTIDHA